MDSVFLSVRSLTQIFDGKIQEFIDEIENVHMVWLEEIQQEANRMFSSDFTTEPELMPKTPSQKKRSRRKRVSLGYQEENRMKLRFSKEKRSKLRGSSVKKLELITEDEIRPEATTCEVPKRTTRRNKQTQAEDAADAATQPLLSSCKTKQSTEPNKDQKVVVVVVEEGVNKENELDSSKSHSSHTSPKIGLSEDVVGIPKAEHLSAAELVVKPKVSPGRSATRIEIAGPPDTSRRSSARVSLKLRHSLAGLRHSMTHESVRRASRRSMLKKKAGMGNSTCSSDDFMETEEKVEDVEDDVPQVEPLDTMFETGATDPEMALEGLIQENQDYASDMDRSCITRSKALLPDGDLVKTPSRTSLRSHQNAKRKAPDLSEESPTKRPSPPKKSQSVIRPNMRSFLHTVQKNQMLMMAPSSLGRSGVIKSFIKHATPLKVDPKSRERQKLEALKKKQEHEEERLKKMEEEKKRKQEEQKRKRDERLRRVVEAKVKGEKKEEEKKKKIEQKMAQIDEKNDKLRSDRFAEERAKKKVALKRQEEQEQKRKLEEEARKRKLQQMEEEKRQQEFLAKRKAEEEQVRKLAEARKALEQKREQERELERERREAAERERIEKEKALALQRELEKAAREKEERELEEKRKRLEEKRKREEQQRLAAEEQAAKEKAAAIQREAAAKNIAATHVQQPTMTPVPVSKSSNMLNITVDIEKSPQSYTITPKRSNKPMVVSKNADDYGMDQNSDDSTDDESAPRKPIPSWAEGSSLQQSIIKQYFNPPDLDDYFGVIEPPKLEDIFLKNRPRYFKRTSSAVWHSPPGNGKHF